MKLKFRRQTSKPPGSRESRAMTLAETLIAAGIFSLSIAALLSVQLFALRQNQLTGCKLGAAEQARYVSETLAEDVRSTKVFAAGSYSNGVFVQNSLTGMQTGSALRLAPNLASSSYTYYYFDRSSNAAQCRLFRTTVSPPGTKLLASYLTNISPSSMIFQLEDFKGVTLTNSINCGKTVVHVLLEFWQFQYPTMKIGTNNFYDYFKSEFRVTSHAPG